MADNGKHISISYIHTDIIQAHILTKIDGQTLASAGCASAQLHALCTEEKLWTHICNSTWPSTDDPRVRDAISTFPSGHRSFFSDSFQTPNSRHPPHPDPHCPAPTSQLISAVDLHYLGKLVFSKVELTDTADKKFLSSPFGVAVLDPKEMVPKFESDDTTSTCLLLDLEKHMSLSWIVIDPTRKRSVNLSSTKPVSVERDPSTGSLQVQYAIAMAGAGDGDDVGGSSEFVNCSIDVTCDCKETGELHVREVSLEVQDMDGKRLSGKDSLVIMQEAMEGERRKKVGREEDRKRYEEYLGMKRKRNERKERKERKVDLLWLTAEVTILVALWARILIAM